jgi:hypothetical protein
MKDGGFSSEDAAFSAARPFPPVVPLSSPSLPPSPEDALSLAYERLFPGVRVVVVDCRER